MSKPFLTNSLFSISSIKLRSFFTQTQNYRYILIYRFDSLINTQSEAHDFSSRLIDTKEIICIRRKMSKKKVTMTLKDFHGGHIPSDLPLPSAPGLPSRPMMDRVAFDRQTSYGNPVGRSENRLRPASVGSARNLDDENIFFNYNPRIGRNFDEDERKPLYGVSGPRRTIGEESILTQHSRVTEPQAEDTTPFLSHCLQVGRNFDEDERKPLNGVSGPRRTVNDESIHVQPTHVMELKKDQVPSAGHTTNFCHSFNADEVNPLNGVSDPGHKVGNEVHNAGPNSQNFGGSCGYLSNHTDVGARNRPYENAWGLKKEIKSVKESVPTSWSPIPDPAMKLAQASALEKVASGRWTSKQHVPLIKNHEVIGKLECGVGPDYKAANNVESEKVGQVIQADRNVPVDLRSNERKSPDEKQPLDALSRSLQTVVVDSFVAAHSSLVAEPRTDNKSDASIVSRAPPVTMTQASSSYFGGPNSYWSKEPVSIAWSSPEIIMNLPHSGSFESDRWNSKEHLHCLEDAVTNGHLETPGEFDYRTNNISSEFTSNKIVANRRNVVDDSEYHDLAEMMHAKGNLVAIDEIYDSGKEMQSYEIPKSNIRALHGHMAEPKLGYAFGSRVVNRAQSPQISSGFTSSSFGFNQQFSGDGNYWSGNSNVVGDASKPAIGPYSNPWGHIKATSSMKEPASADWSAPDVTGKLTNAGAFDKVSSGIWNSKNHPSKYDGSIGHLVPEGDFEYKDKKEINAVMYTTNRLDVMEETGFRKPSPPLPVERSLAVDYSTYGCGKDHERVRSFEKNVVGSQLIQSPEKSSNAESRSALLTESLERPKLKLLPRSKPLENSEPRVGLNQGFGQSKDDIHVANSIFESRKSEFSGLEVADQAPQQPKLNLKPRSQPIDQLKGSGDISRETVFGGARPREVLLKERGAEDDMCHTKNQLPLRGNDTARKDDPYEYVTSTCYNERADKSLNSQRTTSKYANRQDHQLDSARIDSQRRNFRQNETRRNHKEVEKNRQVQERPPSPETWRKPIDHSKPSSSDGPPLRFGKAASAVELAQAFSRSVSDPSLSDRMTGSRNLSGHGQVLFSRLMGPTPRLQINGY